MNTTVKRILCLFLVVCLMITMPGCSSVGDLAGTLWHLARRVTCLLGFVVIIPAMWVVDLVTWPFVEFTGFNVNALGNNICQAWTELILPEQLMEDGDWGGWFVIRDEDELEARLRKGGHLEEELEETTGAGNQDKLYADPTFPTETFYAEGSAMVDKEPGIHYDANGGEYAPEDQIITADSKKSITITGDVPTRAGYHFMGWTSEYSQDKVMEVLDTGIMHNCNTAQYQPGDKIDGEYEKIITEGITLYAIWDERALFEEGYMPLPSTNHVFTVEQVMSGRNPTPNVSITCSCGMTVTDRDLLEIDFLAFCKNMKTPMKTSDAAELYRLYLAQDIGPLALQFNTMAYDENILFQQVDLEFVEINTGKVNPEPECAAFFQELKSYAGKMKKVTPTVEKYFKKMQSGEADKKEVEKMLKEVALGKKLDAAGKVFNLFRLLAATGDMLDTDKHILDQTVGMLEVIESVASFTKFGSAVKDVSKVLQEGLKLIKKCEKTRTKYHNALTLAAAEGNKELGKPTITAYLEEVMGDSRIAQAYQELVLTGTPGCTCGSSDTCNFDAAGMCLKNFPDVATVIWRMQNTSLEPTALEKSFLALYLAERSRHELYRQSGLTLQQYAQMLTN